MSEIKIQGKQAVKDIREHRVRRVKEQYDYKQQGKRD